MVLVSIFFTNPRLLNPLHWKSTPIMSVVASIVKTPVTETMNASAKMEQHARTLRTLHCRQEQAHSQDCY
jgi:hypothetical protein